MFISTRQLTNSYGIDPDITRFFVDREPPANNLYWHEKLLYLRPSPGYLFIPLIVDLLYRIGIRKDKLLSDDFVGVMEGIGHISALEETKRITSGEAVNRCGELVGQPVNAIWKSIVTDYFSGKSNNLISKQVTAFKALHRGDVFLFSICALPFPEALFVVVTQQWFALISTLLLLDDAEDIAVDKESGDSNAFIESGLDQAGVQKISWLINSNVQAIRKFNPIMAEELERKCDARLRMPDILQLTVI